MERYRFFDRDMILLLVFSVSVFSIAYFLAPANAGREMNIPPTGAFSRIITDNGVLQASDWNDWVDMRSTDSVNVTMSGHNIYFWGMNGSSTPTDYFGTVKINGNTVKASAPNSTITINTQGSLSCTKSGDVFTCKLSQVTCGALQGIKGVDANGNLFCGLI
jgi:hypothetical protein